MEGRIAQHLAGTPPRRVVVLRALQLGDMLCAVPALRALRAGLPSAEIVLVGLPWARVFCERFGCYLDGFRELPGYPGLPERPPQPEQIPTFLTALRAERFDLAIQLHGSGSVTNPLTVLFGARRTAGFYHPGGYCPYPALFLPYPGRGLEVRRLLKLMRFLGFPADREDLEFPLHEEDFQELRAQAGAGNLLPGGYVCIHPRASVPQRRWPAERFADVARALHNFGLRVVLTGTAGEVGLTAAVARELGAECLDLAGRTSLGSLAALLSGARLLVCNDTGVSHLADALCIPSVVISTGDNPSRWAPADTALHRVLCAGDGGAVRSEEVIRQAEVLLDHVPARPAVKQKERACAPRAS